MSCGLYEGMCQFEAYDWRMLWNMIITVVVIIMYCDFDGC